MRRPFLFGVCFFASASVFAQGTATPQRGVLRSDLVGTEWRQLPATKWPGSTLPLPWAGSKHYELRFFQPSFGKYILTVTEVKPTDPGYEVIRAAVDFSALRKGEWPEHDCFYRSVPPCDGRLCEGLLLGVIAEPRPRNGRYQPLEVWKITSKTLRFEKVAARDVVCKPQSYDGG